jgi:site-specific recombinase XerD
MGFAWFRHPAATRFARAGVPLQKAQRILKHSDPALTAQIYSHLEVDDLREAVERIGAPHTSMARSRTA